jgi:L-lactate dehydrogenase complex protein LldG
LETLGGVFKISDPDNLNQVVLETLAAFGSKQILSWYWEDGFYEALLAELKRCGYELVHPYLSVDMEERKRQLAGFGQFEIGISGAIAGLGETGTIILPDGPDRSQMASLLPFNHIAILPLQSIYPTMEAWLAAGGAQTIESSSQMNFITGPSRTADIEMTLTIGVHGPGNLIVIGIDESH